MNFHLSEEQELIRSLVRQIAEDLVASGARTRDEEASIDKSLFCKLGELGLTAVLIPEELGGVGGGAVSFAVVIEELSAVCASTAAVLAAHQAFCLWPVSRFGSDEAKQEVLGALVSGRKLGGCALSSAGGNPSFTSKRSGEAFLLDGSHDYVINAPDANYFTVLTGGGSRSRVRLFIVPAELSGLKKGEAVSKLGLRGLLSARLSLEGCSIPRRYQIGKKGQIEEILRDLSVLGDIGASAQSVGVAQTALNKAAHYARSRRQFGESIGSKQGIAFKLADMKAQIEAARLLLYQAAWRMDNGLLSSREAALARVYSSTAAINVAIEAIQIWGGYGYIRDVGIERLLRDAVCIESDYGTGAMGTNPLSRIWAN